MDDMGFEVTPLLWDWPQSIWNHKISGGNARVCKGEGMEFLWKTTMISKQSKKYFLGFQWSDFEGRTTTHHTPSYINEAVHSSFAGPKSLMWIWRTTGIPLPPSFSQTSPSRNFTMLPKNPFLPSQKNQALTRLKKCHPVTKAISIVHDQDLMISTPLPLDLKTHRLGKKSA